MNDESATTIESQFEKVITSSVFRLDGEDIELPEELTKLANLVRDADDVDWNIGEFEEASLDSLLIGAHWALGEWHAGQSSPEYVALSAIGQVFSPGMTDGPEPNSGELTAYELITDWFKEKNSKGAR